MGCDLWKDNSIRKSGYFNPRTHRGVRHTLPVLCKAKAFSFQSTHPSWGATKPRRFMLVEWQYFNPRTHRGVRRCERYQTLTSARISIHAPIVGCDSYDTLLIKSSLISIHAPIVGCDKKPSISIPCYIYFNPRTHRGVRR